MPKAKILRRRQLFLRYPGTAIDVHNIKMVPYRLQKSLGAARLKHRISSVPRTQAPTCREAAEANF
jgi:hypothetical protein